MSVVIPFAPRERPESAEPAAMRDGSAEILFFTGIRYERHAENPAPRVQAVRAPRKRRGQPA